MNQADKDYAAALKAYRATVPRRDRHWDVGGPMPEPMEKWCVAWKMALCYARVEHPCWAEPEREDAACGCPMIV